MKISIKESRMVYPIQETPTENIWLSNLDLVQLRIHVPSAFFYKPNGCSDFFDTEVLVEALSKALVPFYPVAGRLGLDENGRVEIKCAKDGVLFVEAEADSAVDDELSHFINGYYGVFGLLLPKLDYSKGLSSFPLFLVQVTKFKCGGVCLAIGFHHALADGHSALHFINSWSNIARGGSANIPPPYMDRTIFRCRNPPTPNFPHTEFLQQNQQNPSESTDSTTFEILKITRHQLDVLKNNRKTKETKTKYTTNTLLIAHIWRCACKARCLEDKEETSVYIVVDGRSRLDPPVPEGYFGNALLIAVPNGLSGEIVSEPLACTVERVQKAIKRIDNEYLSSAIDYLEQVDDITKVYTGGNYSSCPNMRIVSWLRMPFYEVHDFGWGRPWYMKAGTPAEGKAHLVESANDDGSLLLPICLKTDHFQAFKKLFYETWPLGL